MKRLPIRRYLKELPDVLARRTSLSAYLARNFPSLFGIESSKIIRWKGHLLFSDALQEIEFFDLIVEKQIYSIPECRVEEGDVFDVGAHMGFFSYHAKLCGAEAIYAFEPNPYVFEILKKHAKMWSDKIKPYQLALSDKNGEADLFISEGLELGGISTMLENREKSILKSYKYNKKSKVKTMMLLIN